MTDPTRRPDRRGSDTRLFIVERDLARLLVEQERTNVKLDKVVETLSNIQAEPEQFPAGRALLRRADSNRSMINKHTEDIEALEKAMPDNAELRIKTLEAKDSERDGAWKFMLRIQTVIGIGLAFLALYAFTQGKP